VADILSISQDADVVFFEFCLHEMSDPAKALKHAKGLAPNILLIDHHPDSPWGWCICEDTKVSWSWEEARRLNVIREVSYKVNQEFDSYSELLSKVEVGNGPHCLDSLMGNISSEPISMWRHQAASANG
jgi:hypothetical protein